jgi:hypothetical protein
VEISYPHYEKRADYPFINDILIKQEKLFKEIFLNYLALEEKSKFLAEF